MIKIPKNLLSLSEAAKKYGFKNSWALHDYIQRGRLEAARIGHIWYTSDQAMREYLNSRDLSKIPKRYRKKH